MGETCRNCEYFLSSHFDKNVGVCTLENDICLVENAESNWCDFYEEVEGEVLAIIDKYKAESEE